MSFINTLNSRGLDYVLTEHQFRPIVPINGQKFAELLKRIVNENLRVFVDFDCDPDGYFSGLALVETFKLLNFTNYSLVRHSVKRHSISDAEATSMLNAKYDVIFILDSSTNDMELITKIVNSGTLCCVVDHHDSHYQFCDYPTGSIVINPKIDATYHAVCYDCLSAGAIMSLLCTYTLQTEFKIKPPIDLYLYGVITLYSDIMRMDNPYNIAFVSKFQNTQLATSKLIKLFWNQYTHFDKSYISFTLIPRLNALFRTENFDLLYKLFFEGDTLDYDSVKEKMEEHYKECKKYVDRLVSSCYIREYNNIVLAVIDSSYASYARNFTGLVANKISADHNKTVLCLHQTTPLTWQGSVRDSLNRNLLSLFRPICYAEGHASAFGIEINVEELDSAIDLLDTSIPMLDKADSVIILDWDNNPNFGEEIQQMAIYNEFGGQGLPVAMGALTIKPRYKIYRSEHKISVYGDGQKFICCVPTLDVGDTMLVKPTLSGSSYTNFVNTVHLK